jgi:hypothetical protein
MPIDPNIALSVKPVQLANPLEQYMQVQQIQQAQNQSRLADLMYGEKQRQIARGNNLLNLMKGLPQDATDDQRMNTLRGNGYFDEADKLDTSIQNRTKTKAEAQKNQAEAMGKYLDATKQVAGRVMAMPTQENANAALNSMEMLGKQLGFDVSGDIANERQALANLKTPEEIKQWAAAHSMQADKMLPKIDTRNMGGTTDTISIDPVTGKVVVMNSVRNTQSPDNTAIVAATRRGQDLTDARARELNQQGQYDSDRGMLVNKRTGVAVPVVDAKGNPLQGGKPMTEFQGKSAAFSDRAQEADAILGKLTGQYSPAAINAKQSVQEWPIIGGATGAITNKFALSEADQRAEQAQRNFVNAILRQESGAVISPSEFENAKQQYFPQPGDTPALIAQKAANRKTAIAGLSRSAGPSYTPPAAGDSGVPDDIADLLKKHGGK